MTAVSPTILSATGPGRHGGGIYMRVATTGAAQTVQLGPYKLQDPDKVALLRDAGPKDTAGALSSVSFASDGKSITFTAASVGEVGLFLMGAIQMQ